MSNVERRRFMSTITESRPTQVLSKTLLIVLSALCLQFICGCASKPSSEEEVINQAIKYASVRAQLDTAPSSVVYSTPDAAIDISVAKTEETSSGNKEIKLEPAVISDTMTKWNADEWLENRNDLFFNLAAHFGAICKQAHEYGNIPDGYTITCPDYMVVYDSKKSTGFIVNSKGVYKKTNDPINPMGETMALADKVH